MIPFIAELDDTSKTVVTLLAGLIVPAVWRSVKNFLAAPGAQDVKWKDHMAYHEQHTKDHGHLDSVAKAFFINVDELKKDNVQLHKKIAYLEGKVNGHDEEE